VRYAADPLSGAHVTDLLVRRIRRDGGRRGTGRRRPVIPTGHVRRSSVQGTRKRAIQP
jgi:hypothetical protein